MMAMEHTNLNLNLSEVPQAATMPPEWRGLSRDEVKLLVLDKKTGQTAHVRFHELPQFLHAGDVIVVNTSGTLAANLLARIDAPEKSEEIFHLHVAVQLEDGSYIIERRSVKDGPDSRPFCEGSKIQIMAPMGGLPVAHLTVRHKYHPNSRLWVVDSDRNLFTVAQSFGQPIRYGYIEGAPALGLYQTIFARDFHSAEMPSAARPFSARVLRDLGRRGVKVASLTLHTGVSSHEVEGDLTSHPIIPEWYSIPEYTANLVNEAHKRGRRIIAVGTTVVRALEGAAAKTGTVSATSGWTRHIVTPLTPPKIVTGLITGMHATQTSHLALLYGFVRREWLESAYEEAIQKNYLWHEFGDSNLIL